MGNGSLSRVMAARAVDAIVRQHALLNGSQCAALRLELEQLILAPSERLLEVAKHDRQPRSQLANHYVGAIAVLIGEQLHRSDHVEDIYASDDDIRRDVTDVVTRCWQTHLRTRPDTRDDGHALMVQIDELGATARYLAGALHPASLRQVLHEAAQSIGITLRDFSHRSHTATFTTAADRANMMRLEDAIVSALLRWAGDGHIELPAIEQRLHWPSDSLNSTGVAAALARACERVKQHSGCLPQTTVLNENTLQVRLLPLSAAAESNLDNDYDELLEALQQALASVANGPAQGSEAPPPVSTRYPAAVPPAPSSAEGESPVSSSPFAPQPAASHASRRRGSGRPARRNRQTGG